MNNKNRSSLDDHQKKGKKLIPPLKQISNLDFTSWHNRLPEYLYAALLTANLSQEEYLIKFRLMVEHFAYVEEDLRPEDLSLTSLSKCDKIFLRNALHTLFDDKEIKSILKPLLLFKELPAYPIWKDIIGSEASEDDWNILKIAIGKTLYHNSQASTDIRWLCVVYKMACGNIRINEDLIDIMNNVWNYPYEGDLKEVRPTIRVLEGSLAYWTENSAKWVTTFWEECLSRTTPEVLVKKRNSHYKIDKELSKRFKTIWNKLFQRFYDTLETSDADAKHDTSFGLVMYSLRILTECVNRNTGNYLIGRILLRSLVENYITFAYLVKKDKIELWEAYRRYGAGQAKLVSLKAEKYESDPSFISFDDVNEIANEDMREEFVDIDLGHWAGVDLRKMSEYSDTKKTYDKYYDWTSGYSHGNWAAVRDSIYTTDFNPLHKLMRVPSPKLDFNDVIGDMMEIMNLQLSLLSELYELEDLTI
ncbi:MAG: DUF5677 domain-containing protein [Methanobacterium formicicum]